MRRCRYAMGNTSCHFLQRSALLFFVLESEHTILADSNPELIDMYRAVALDAEQVIAHLARHEEYE